MTARSPTMVTFHDSRFVESRWWNDGWTVKTVVTWRWSACMIPAPDMHAVQLDGHRQHQGNEADRHQRVHAGEQESRRGRKRAGLGMKSAGSLKTQRPGEDLLASCAPAEVTTIITKTTTTIITKGEIRDFLQSLHCAVNCFQHVRLSGQGAIVCQESHLREKNCVFYAKKEQATQI